MFFQPRGLYHDPHAYDPASPRDANYLAAIKNGRALLAFYKRDENGTLHRYDYGNSIILVSDVTHDETGLRFGFTIGEYIGYR